MNSTQDQFYGSSVHHHTSFLAKGRRTKRQRISSALTSASSSGGNGGGGGGCGGGGGDEDNSDYGSTSSRSPLDDHDHDRDHDLGIMSKVSMEEEDLANCLILLAKGKSKGKYSEISTYNNNKLNLDTDIANNNNNNNQLNPGDNITSNNNEDQSNPSTNITNPSNNICSYECKTCNRTFTSFQALGGHRASHKKPKPNSTIRSPDNQEDRDLVDHDHDNIGQLINKSISINNGSLNNNNKLRVHECSICGSEFPSGQALGGHMRRHRTPQPPAPPAGRPIESCGPRSVLPLDLNLPAPDDDDDDDHMGTKFHVLPTPALVDCHY